MSASAVVPAYNEEERVASTVSKLLDGVVDRVIVVDDGSTDETVARAEAAGAMVLSHPTNRGKGAAVNTGLLRALADQETEWILLADADLGESAGGLRGLVEAVRAKHADVAIAQFKSTGGFGMARRLASQGIRWLTGFEALSPLSGQRALTRAAAESLVPFPSGWGLEVGMTVRALWNGCRVIEVPLRLTHRETKRDLQGFRHRGRQCADVLATLWKMGCSRLVGRMGWAGRP